MNRELALEALSSEKTEVRLRGARALSRNGLSYDLDTILSALNHESNRWVKSALRAALLYLEGGHSPNPTEVWAESEDDRLVEEIRSEAVQETTKQLIHEIRPILGRLRLHLTSEIPNHLGSQAWRECEALSGLLKAMDQLAVAAASPIYAEFDLAEVIEEIAATEAFNQNIKIELAGPRPLVVQSCEGLVRIVLSNGLRNAIESSEAVNSVSPVIISWGLTDRDFWISVLDAGRGIPANLATAFEIGTTTKKGHFGMGLALARQAVQSLNGKISLIPRKEGGAQFEVIFVILP